MNWLDKLLEELGWTAADLGRATGLDSAVISNLRNGRRGLGLIDRIQVSPNREVVVYFRG